MEKFKHLLRTDKYNLEEVTWRDIFALFIGKLLSTSLSVLQIITLSIIMLLLIGYFIANFYFSKTKSTVIMPGAFVNASDFTKGKIQNDLIHSLTVKEVTIDSLPKYLAVRGLNRGYSQFIDKVTPQEVNQQSIITIGEPLYDMQISAFLAVNTYMGNKIDYDKDIIITSIGLSGGVSPTILPNDILLTLDGKEVNNTMDIEVAKLHYKPRELKVLRKGKPLTLQSSLYGVEVKKVTTLANQKDYEEFYKFANLELKRYTGRSAGASIALSYYNNHIEDVARDRKIAITGTISETGDIGFISGVRQKTALAIKNKVDILFVPTDNEILQNYTDALKVVKETKSDLTVVPVATFSDMIAYLKK